MNKKTFLFILKDINFTNTINTLKIHILNFKLN